MISSAANSSSCWGEAGEALLELLALQLIQSTEIRDHALPHPGFGAKAFDDLQLAPASGAGDARVHVPSLPARTAT